MVVFLIMMMMEQNKVLLKKQAHLIEKFEDAEERHTAAEKKAAEAAAAAPKIILDGDGNAQLIINSETIPLGAQPASDSDSKKIPRAKVRKFKKVGIPLF